MELVTARKKREEEQKRKEEMVGIGVSTVTS